MKLISYSTEYEMDALGLAEQVGGLAIKFDGKGNLLGSLTGGKAIKEWHVFADAGVYGFFCSENKNYPDWIGQDEWQSLEIPFKKESKVFLHHEYADRWLAPMLADRYQIEVTAVKGEKIFHPRIADEDKTYDSSAALYDAAFADIKVREIEWDYVVDLLTQNNARNVIEIGCGNGQLLRQLIDENVISSATGFDTSKGMVEKANGRHAEVERLDFKLIEKSNIPLDDGSVDAVISFMSYRYLDWQPLMHEVNRVLRNGGVFIMVDMAETELSEEDRPLYLETKKRTEKLHAERPEFSQNLKNLVAHPEWKTMLNYHPKRLATEYENFLTSRYPDGNWQRLYVCFDHSLFGFHFIK